MKQACELASSARTASDWRVDLRVCAVKGLLESAFADSGYGHAHRVIPLVNVNSCSGNAAAKGTGQKRRDRADFLGCEGIGDG